MGTPVKHKFGKNRRWLGGAVAAALVIGGMSPRAHAISQFFFSWSNANADSPPVNFAAAPILNDSDYVAVANQLAVSKSKGYPLAVKITAPLASGGNAITQVLNKFNVQYVFLDFEGSNAVSQVSTFMSQVNSTQSANAFVGNFNYYSYSNEDSTSPNQSNPPHSEFVQSGLSTRSHAMTNETLYPGSPDYRTPGASGNNSNVNAGGSTAPNIRSALFTLPIERLTMVTNALYGRGNSLNLYNSTTFDPSFDPTGHAEQGLNVPWVTRFDNFGNAALTNLPGTKATPYRFNGTVDANPADGQLPSRGDFSAQVLQYRMRGANSINLFLASVTDQYGSAYTESEQEADMNAGWFATQTNGTALNGSSTMNSIFYGHYGFANLTSLIRLDVPTTVKGKTVIEPASPSNAEKTGVIWSGVYAEGSNNKPTLNSSSMAILLSNMSGATRTVDLGTVAGYSVYDPNSPAADKSGFNVTAGQHLLLTFSLKDISGSPVWDLSTNTIVFTDNDRDGIGTPEPASLGLLGIGALGLLARRRRPTSA
jgi:hypothetical protein